MYADGWLTFGGGPGDDDEDDFDSRKDGSLADVKSAENGQGAAWLAMNSAWQSVGPWLGQSTHDPQLSGPDSRIRTNAFPRQLQAQLEAAENQERTRKEAAYQAEIARASNVRTTRMAVLDQRKSTVEAEPLTEARVERLMEVERERLVVDRAYQQSMAAIGVDPSSRCSDVETKTLAEIVGGQYGAGGASGGTANSADVASAYASGGADDVAGAVDVSEPAAEGPESTSSWAIRQLRTVAAHPTLVADSLQAAAVEEESDDDSIGGDFDMLDEINPKPAMPALPVLAGRAAYLLSARPGSASGDGGGGSGSGNEDDDDEADLISEAYPRSIAPKSNSFSQQSTDAHLPEAVGATPSSVVAICPASSDGAVLRAVAASGSEVSNTSLPESEREDIEGDVNETLPLVFSTDEKVTEWAEEFIVARGTTRCYNVMLSASHGPYAWAFMLVDGGGSHRATIDFTVTFNATDGEPVIVAATTATSGTWCSGHFTPAQAGRLSLNWDNTGSLLYPRQIVLKTRCRADRSAQQASVTSSERIDGRTTTRWAIGGGFGVDGGIQTPF